VLTKARGDRSQANLLRGGGRSSGRPPKSDRARALALRLLDRPKHLQTLAEKLDTCTLHPSIHVALMYYGWGKPKEVIETTAATKVVINFLPLDEGGSS
jgi:hypothetical protein